MSWLKLISFVLIIFLSEISMGLESMRIKFDQLTSVADLKLEELSSIFNFNQSDIDLVKSNKYFSFYEILFEPDKQINTIKARKRNDSDRLSLVSIIFSPNDLAISDVADVKPGSEIDLSFIPSAGIEQITYVINEKKVTFSSGRDGQLMGVILNYDD